MTLMVCALLTSSTVAQIPTLIPGFVIGGVRPAKNWPRGGCR